MKTLSLCMIVKDGERYIEQCLESVSPAVSEIIIVDTGSTDSTLERVKRFNPQIYHFEWNNNFADARNMSLKHAKGDYILVLDADEVIYKEDIPKLIKSIKNTNADCVSIRFHNITNEHDETAFNIHEGLRIFKNGSFHFEGAIHEQPIFNFKDRNALTDHSGVRIKHYGYLKSNSGEKKFNRNMTILKDVLEKTPEEPFHLFNMGNQYMSIGDYNTALEYYEKAEKFRDIKLAYYPHLVFRRASCLRTLRRGEECLEVIKNGLSIYPAFTDLEFLRGKMLISLKRFTLALDSFKRCIDMGPAPSTLCFFDDTATVKPFIEIAEIYNLMEDFEKALEFYLKALRTDGKKYQLIYRIASCLNKMLDDKNLVYKNLCNLFADSNYKSNVVVMSDALLDEKLLEQADFAVNKYMNKKNAVEDSDIFFLKGRIAFYSKKYDVAFSNFKKTVQEDTVKGILPNSLNRAYEYMLVCSLLDDKYKNEFIEMVEPKEESLQKNVYYAFLTDTNNQLDNNAILVIASILSKLLVLNEYDIFEKSLNILNLLDNKDVLLRLADIYFINGFHDMAVKTIVRSIKELDSLDSAAVMILNKEFNL